MHPNRTELALLLAALAFAPAAQAGYTPTVAVQDEAAVSCGTPQERDRALFVIKSIPATMVRVNAMQDGDCDPVGAIKAIRAAGLKSYVTVLGSDAYVRTLAKQVGYAVNLWGIWNEANLESWRFGAMRAAGMHPTESYRRVFIRQSRILRKLDKGAKVLIGELATGRDKEWLTAATRKHHPLRADGIALHAYIWYGEPEIGLRNYLADWITGTRKMARQRRLCLPAPRHPRHCYQVPLYITESGYLQAERDDIPPWEPRVLAKWMPRYYKTACQAGVKMITHYQLFSNGQAWDTGLITPRGPRPLFGSWKGYIKNAKGCKGKAGRPSPTIWEDVPKETLPWPLPPGVDPPTY